MIEGQLILTLDGATHHLSPGQSLTVPPGRMHSYAPAGGTSVVIEVELWPHRQDHLFFETIYGLTRDGRLPPRRPADMLALLALCHRHRFFMQGPARALIRPVAAEAAPRLSPWPCACTLRHDGAADPAAVT